ncbi:ribonuclease P protein component [Entomoplasma freundtii]|uniref:Ribonuclease P protein component n=1 Tax=Entomoplasma freundtii TaxID=74700 RepID=A0A2K8NU82_9MOLU|nr:ribonuclease P protein component [Entomoplasma freundtii]ATZ16728.1 ribonuclease P (protein C5) [Entomoplasma freundtii]TDY58105.1 ribonuclease P protein component [Entomoplasma freundtii]
MKNKRIIKKNFEFQDIIGEQKTLKNTSYVIYYYPSSPSENYLRYGISVGKKVGHAPTRNLLKRQVRQMLQKALVTYGDKPYRLIIIVRPDFLKKTFLENQNNLNALLKRLK